jgi:hypothetical protein
VEMLLQLLMPLPPIDLHLFAKMIESRFWAALFAMENPEAQWWERTGVALWLAVFETARAFGVPVRLEAGRMMQSACLYDHLAGRLGERLRFFKEFRRYTKAARRRAAKRRARRADNRADRGRAGTTAFRAQKMIQQLTLQLESLIDDLPIQFQPMSKKASYFTSQMLSMLIDWAKLGLIIAGGYGAYGWSQTGAFDPRAALIQTADSPVFYAAGFLLVVLTSRRVLYRLNDVDRRG